ncbi:MAG: DNA polymerase III subunit delta [Deltaproteobacteria bacterium]|nr:DNA polymerase III subunit delta [Deltaproteobacteria bacterium]
MRGKLDGALKDIEKGTIAPCDLLWGDENYLVEKTLGGIVDHMLPPAERDLSLFQMEGDSTDMDTIVEAVLTPSLMPGRKVVVVKNTRLFYSTSSSADIAGDMLRNLERDVTMAARAFAVFLGMVGWTLEDLQDEEWKKIPEGAWQEAVGAEAAREREKWLPRLLAECKSLGIKEKRYDKDTGPVEEVLKGGLPEGNCLILTADTVDKRKKLYKTISEIGIILHFPSAKKEAEKKGLLSEAARDILSERGKSVSPGALSALAKKTGFDIQASMEELEKLITYAGDRGVIDENDIKALTGRKKEDSVFELTSAVVERDLEKALLILHNLLDQGVHHLMILTMIVREIRFLLQGKIILKSEVISSFRPGMDYRKFQDSLYPSIKALGESRGTKKGWLFGQHPYVIYNALRNSGRFSYDELVGYMNRLVDVDLALKTTGMKPRIVLEHLLMDICR